MPVAEAAHLEAAFADAERRLRRPLTEAELRIDIVRADRDLAEGKARLAAAIEEEKRRVLSSRVRGIHDRMELTVRMIYALLWIYDAGRRHARWEMEKMRVTPTIKFAERPVPPGVGALAEQVRARLPAIDARVADTVATRGDFGGLVGDAIVGRLATLVPGPLGIAADLVSSGFNTGLAEGYEANAELFSGWQYTAVMDDNTCDECEAADGTEYETLAEALDAMPNFGPNPACYGGGRCRCRLVPLGPAEAPPVETPIDETPPDVAAAAPADVQTIETFLTTIRDARGVEGVNAGREDVLLRRGKVFTNEIPPPRDLPEGTPKQCYVNAFHIAEDNADLTYVEGYVLPEGIDLPIEHAWVVDRLGRVYDTTLATRGRVYFGVPLTDRFMLTQAVERETYGPFINHDFPYYGKRIPKGVIEPGIPGTPIKDYGKAAAEPRPPSAEAFGTTDPYVYHLDSTNASVDRVREAGLKPSKTGQSGPGVYMGNTEESTLYYATDTRQGTLYRIDKSKLIERFGKYPDAKDGVEFDETTGEVLLGGKRAIPPEFIEVRDVDGVWRPLVSVKSPASEIAATIETEGAPLIEAARRLEPLVTADLSEIAFRNGGVMQGLEYRIKSPASLERKILDTMKNRGETAEEARAGIWDALRYTTTFETDVYTERVEATLAELESRGYRIVDEDGFPRNYWDSGGQYRGLNLHVVSPDGEQFELQFHTPQSWYVKETENHPLYLIARNPETPLAQQRELDRIMTVNADKIPRPPGVQRLGHPARIPRPKVMQDDPTTVFPARLDVDSYQRLGEATLNDVFEVDQRGEKYVVKINDPTRVIRRSITPGLDADRERAAYVMARYFTDTDPAYAVNVAPIRVGKAALDGGRAEKASIARFVEGKVGGHLDALSDEAVRGASLFDLVTGNLDRHPGNFVVSTDSFGDTAWLIDNGLSFPTTVETDDGVFVREWISRGHPELSDDDLAFLRALKKRRPEIDRDLGLPPELVSTMWTRVDLLIQNRDPLIEGVLQTDAIRVAAKIGGEPIVASGRVDRVAVEVPDDAKERGALLQKLDDLGLKAEIVLGEVPLANGFVFRVVYRVAGGRGTVTIDFENSTVAALGDLKKIFGRLTSGGGASQQQGQQPPPVGGG